MHCAFTPYEGSEDYIFVSYSHQDDQRAAPILEELDRRGYRIWYDDGIQTGTDWPQSIEQHLKGCAVLMALHSASSVRSDYCKNEICYALDQKKAILPVFLEKVELSGGLAWRLTRIQAVNAYEYDSVEEICGKICGPRSGETPLLDSCRAVPESPEEAPAEPDPEAEELVLQGNQYFYQFRNYIQALKCYRAAAARGSAAAQRRLGEMYLFGDGVEKSYAKAREWLEKSADQGDARAMLALGNSFYLRPAGEKDYEAARPWYEKAAASSASAPKAAAAAKFHLGDICLWELGDYAGAKRLYEEASALGSPDAQCQLGMMYFYKKGVDRDYAAARAWFEKAAENGSKRARKMLEEWPETT